MIGVDSSGKESRVQTYIFASTGIRKKNENNKKLSSVDISNYHIIIQSPKISDFYIYQLSTIIYTFKNKENKIAHYISTFEREIV